eukprot:TRINITY_DN30103_c0_g1_i1.p1 TRINITY_DN30103_c0_g1~~TRINITY_DN30103_c0_g1_i1.p1  ORF type:complete len:739 (+),score=194.88 TRINITY_DN30103_c0_g1_i1:39-2255(+)
MFRGGTWSEGMVGLPWRRRYDMWVVVAAAVAAYANSWSHGFCLDDTRAILQNEDLDAAKTTLADVFANDFWGDPLATSVSHKSYRPLTILTYRWTAALFALEPAPFHIGNIAIYAAACGVWHWFLARLPMVSRIGRFVAALLFTLHPTHVENVASLVGRADTMAMILYLVCVDVYQRGARRGGGVGAAYLAAAWVLAFAGMLLKEHGLLALPVAAAFDLCMNGRLLRPGEWGGRLPAAGARTAASAAVTIAIFAWGLWMRGEKTQPSMVMVENPMAREDSVWVRVTWWSEVHFWYFVLMFYPRWSCVDWGYNVIPRPAFPLWGLATYAATFAPPLLLLTTRHREAAVLCAALLVIPFVPSSGLVLKIGTVLAERLLLLPTLGFALAVGIAFETADAALLRREADHAPPSPGVDLADSPPQGLRRRKPPSASTAAPAGPPGRPGLPLARVVLWGAFWATCVVWFAWTVRGSALWDNPLTLYRNTVETCPMSAKSHMQLAVALKRHQKDNALPEPASQEVDAEREALLQTSIRIAPNYSVPLAELGEMMHEQGRNEESYVYVSRAVASGPSNVEALYRLAWLLFHHKGRLEEGLKAFETCMFHCHRKRVCLRAAWHYSGRYGDALAKVYMQNRSRAGLAEEAVAQYRRVLFESKVADFEPVPADGCQWALNLFGVAASAKRYDAAEEALEYQIPQCAEVLWTHYLSKAGMRRSILKRYGHNRVIAEHIAALPPPEEAPKK